MHLLCIVFWIILWSFLKIHFQAFHQFLIFSFRYWNVSLWVSYIVPVFIFPLFLHLFLGLCGTTCWFYPLMALIFEVYLCLSGVSAFRGYLQVCTRVGQGALFSVLRSDAKVQGGTPWSLVALLYCQKMRGYELILVEITAGFLSAKVIKAQKEPIVETYSTHAFFRKN